MAAEAQIRPENPPDVGVVSFNEAADPPPNGDTASMRPGQIRPGNVFPRNARHRRFNEAGADPPRKSEEIERIHRKALAALQ